MQFALWADIHALFLFWSVAFPLSFRQLKVSGRIHHAHIVSIVLAVIIPVPAALIHFSGGVVNITSSVFPCFGRNTCRYFILLICPASQYQYSCFNVLLFIIWILFKVCCNTLCMWQLEISVYKDNYHQMGNIIVERCHFLE